MWGEMLFRWFKKDSMEDQLWGQMTKVFFMKKNQHMGLRWKLLKYDASKYSMNILSSTIFRFESKGGGKENLGKI